MESKCSRSFKISSKCSSQSVITDMKRLEPVSAGDNLETMLSVVFHAQKYK